MHPNIIGNSTDISGSSTRIFKLRAGESFADLAKGYRVKVGSVSSAGAEVKVELGDYRCLDLDGTSLVEVVDLDYIKKYAFEGAAVPLGLRADLNGDGKLDVLDVTTMINFLFRGSPAPTNCQALEAVKSPALE